jgi:hypothetical protein
MSSILSLLPVVLGITTVAAQQCTIQFDGRIPADFTAAEFDSANGIFNPDFVKGAGRSSDNIVGLQDAADIARKT